MRIVFLIFSLFALSASASPVDMTASQFRLYREYQTAKTDPRVTRLPEAKQTAAIAKNFHVKEKELLVAIQLGDTLAEGIEKRCEKEVRLEMSGTELKGKLGEVKVDATDAHAVAYVEWRNDDLSKLEEEAAVAALIASHAAPITSTVAVWAKDAAGRKVFEAKISASSASRFSQDHIAMFAKARYIRVFEDVRRF